SMLARPDRKSRLNLTGVPESRSITSHQAKTIAFRPDPLGTNRHTRKHAIMCAAPVDKRRDCSGENMGCCTPCVPIDDSVITSCLAQTFQDHIWLPKPISTTSRPIQNLLV